MLVRMQRLGHSVRWELCKHSVDVHKAIAVSVEKEDGSNNVTRWETRRPVRANSGPDNGRQHVVVVHLECGIAHDLEPMHDRLDGSKRVQMGISRDLLLLADVVTAPIEEPIERTVDQACENGGI